MIPRNQNSGTNITTTSRMYADPALIAEDNAATESMRNADALAALVTLIERSRPSWHREALCRDHPDVNFHSRAPKHRAAAFSLCGLCPVRERCLDWAVEIGDFTPDTVLGGMDGSARRRIAAARDRVGKAS
jgi:hypothetical protein